MRDFDFEDPPFGRQPFVALSSATLDHRLGGSSQLHMTLVGDPYSLEVLFAQLEQFMRGVGVDVRTADRPRLTGVEGEETDLDIWGDGG